MAIELPIPIVWGLYGSTGSEPNNSKSLADANFQRYPVEALESNVTWILSDILTYLTDSLLIHFLIFIKRKSVRTMTTKTFTAITPFTKKVGSQNSITCFWVHIPKF